MGKQTTRLDPLAIDIMAETARGFFGARVQLEKKVALFDAFVEALAQKAATVRGAAACLNRLLLTRENAVAFFSAIGIRKEPFSAVPADKCTSIEGRIGFSLTAKRQFGKRVRQAYAQLETACGEYLHGSKTEDETDGQIPVYLGMIEQMGELINTEISALNRNRPPSGTLQFAGQLDTEAASKSAATGTARQYATMDEKLGYKPIDIGSQQIARFPELPPVRQAAPRIKEFCDRLYAVQKNQIKALLSGLVRR